MDFDYLRKSGLSWYYTISANWVIASTRGSNINELLVYLFRFPLNEFQFLKNLRHVFNKLRQ